MPGLWTGDASGVELEPPSLVEPLVERRRTVPPSMPALLSPVEGEGPPWRTQTPCQFARDGPQRPVLARGRADVQRAGGEVCFERHRECPRRKS